jgi:hypothetical protein
MITPLSSWTFQVQFKALKQRLSGSPQFKKVASRNGTTVYKFKKWEVRAETLSMLRYEDWTVRELTRRELAMLTQIWEMRGWLEPKDKLKVRAASA